MKPLSLQQIESQSWLSFQRTGLLDLYVGILALSLVAASLVSHLAEPPWMALATLIVLQVGGLGFHRWGRRRIVEPRIGAVRFGAHRRRNLRRLRLALLACSLITVGIVILTALRSTALRSLFDALRAYGMPTLVALVVGIPTAAIAYVLEMPRLLLHGIVIAGSFFVRVALEPILPPVLVDVAAHGTAAGVILIIGIVLFLRFLRSTPRISFQEDDHGE